MDFKELELDKLGFKPFDKIYRNLPIEKIIEEGLINGETVMGMNGAPIVDTGDYTGRSPNDKYFVVEPSSEDKIWWGPCLLYTSPSPRDGLLARMPSSA